MREGRMERIGRCRRSGALMGESLNRLRLFVQWMAAILLLWTHDVTSPAWLTNTPFDRTLFTVISESEFVVLPSQLALIHENSIPLSLPALPASDTFGLYRRFRQRPAFQRDQIQAGGCDQHEDLLRNSNGAAGRAG